MENKIESRIDIINFLSEKFNYKKYLEIGLREPSAFFNHNPYFDYDKFDKNRVNDLNIISNLELPNWVEKPFYK